MVVRAKMADLARFWKLWKCGQNRVYKGRFVIPVAGIEIGSNSLENSYAGQIKWAN